ncbi:MAG: cyclodeaminase/cyclohydrolase family protein [Clostridium sp.]|uniref:cyclodeaminase/cyclohydrolase family protein n=1 Tax=Clostridium sp. TaxID=1506 RepID=UPI003021BB41
MLDTKTIREFIDELGSNSPAPGGGSVAALCASLGSALSSMVFNLTIGKKVYEALSAEEKELVDKYLVISSNQKDEFLDLMNEDTEAFNGVMAAFKMPKETDEEKANRSAKIQEGYKAATQVPLKVARKAYEVYEGILVCVKYGNKNAISDGGVAALLIQSAVEGAIMNVKINLSSIKDEVYNEEIRKELKSLSENGMKKQQEILAIVNSHM